MNVDDKKYISDIYAEAYSDILPPMQYIESVAVTRNLYNEVTEAFDEAGATLVNGMFHLVETKDPDLNQSNGRYDASVTFVLAPLLVKGIKPKYGDAIDIPDELGNIVRYVVTGFQDKNDMHEVFARLFVTRYSDISKGA